MTLLRGIIQASENLRYAKRCVALCNKNWTVEKFFGSKIEIPLPPKKPLSAYMEFVKEKRQEILKNDPSLSTPNQIRVLAEKWSHLTEDMKKPYEETAREKTLLYGDEHKKFYESLTEEQKEELTRLKAKRMESRRMLRTKKTLRDFGLPKPSKSAYVLYVKSEAKKQQVKYPTEFIKKVAEAWKSLPEDSKREFEMQAEEDKRRYAGEMKEFLNKIMQPDNKKVLKAYVELKGKVPELEKKATPSKAAA